MTYVRKTHDEWAVQGLYCGEWETLFTEETKAEAVTQKKCYDENERNIPHRIKKIRVKNGEE